MPTLISYLFVLLRNSMEAAVSFRKNRDFIFFSKSTILLLSVSCEARWRWAGSLFGATVYSTWFHAICEWFSINSWPFRAARNIQLMWEPLLSTLLFLEDNHVSCINLNKHYGGNLVRSYIYNHDYPLNSSFFFELALRRSLSYGIRGKLLTCFFGPTCSHILTQNVIIFFNCSNPTK